MFRDLPSKNIVLIIDNSRVRKNYFSNGKQPSYFSIRYQLGSLLIGKNCFSRSTFSGAPGLLDRMFAVHAGSRGFDSHRRHMSELFFRSDRPGYPHPVYSELVSSGVRVAVGDCSVTERRWWRPPYQTGKTVHMHANALKT